MGWTGALLGGYIGARLGGALGALLGAAIGASIGSIAGGSDSSSSTPRFGKWKEKPRSRRQPVGEKVYLASAAAMLAKMAKADGVVTADEIRSVEAAFRRLGFSAEARKYAIKVFRQAKDDSHTIYEYALDFASAISSVEVRELFYGLLWDVACADGVVSSAELTLLRRLTKALSIRDEWFAYWYNERSAQSSRGSSGSSRSSGRTRSEDPLAADYRLLEVASTASDDEVRKAYRTKAKRYHPDVIRAQGLPESEVTRATELMSRINSAWDRICSARGMR